jgi:hypothetical protein
MTTAVNSGGLSSSEVHIAVRMPDNREGCKPTPIFHEESRLTAAKHEEER